MITAATSSSPIVEAVEFYREEFAFQCFCRDGTTRLAIRPRFMRINVGRRIWRGRRLGVTPFYGGVRMVRGRPALLLTRRYAVQRESVRHDGTRHAFDSAHSTQAHATQAHATRRLARPLANRAAPHKPHVYAHKPLGPIDEHAVRHSCSDPSSFLPDETRRNAHPALRSCELRQPARRLTRHTPGPRRTFPHASTYLIPPRHFAPLEC